MKTLIFCLYIVIVLVVSIENVFADEKRCFSAYSRMTDWTEKASAAVSRADYCKAADGVEQALNWLGTCEVECRYSKARMERIAQYKRDLINALEINVRRCGR